MTTKSRREEQASAWPSFLYATLGFVTVKATRAGHNRRVTLDDGERLRISGSPLARSSATFAQGTIRISITFDLSALSINPNWSHKVNARVYSTLPAGPGEIVTETSPLAPLLPA